MREASGRDYSPRPHPGFFQRETSQAELVNKPMLMKQGQSVTKTWEPTRELMVEVYTVIIKTQDLY